jgi:CRISPR-associated protein Csy1
MIGFRADFTMTGRQRTGILANARARLEAGDVAGAREMCAPIAGSLDAEEAAAAHLVLYECARRALDWPTAREHLAFALDLDPANPSVHYASAQLLEHSGDVRAAIASLEHAVQLKPTFVAALQLLGILQAESGSVRAAVDTFIRAVAVDPANARAYNNLGNALRKLGRQDEARAAFERAVALRPDYELAIANAAAAWRDAGEPERAEDLLRATLTRRTGRQPLRQLVVLLAGLLRERGAFDEAEPLYEKAIAMAPERSAGEHFNLGRLYSERNEPERARKAYARCFAMDPKDLRGTIAARLTLPIVYSCGADLKGSRERYVEGLGELHRSADRLVAGLEPDQVLDGVRWTNFLLAYQGQDDRDLQLSYAAFVAKLIDFGAPTWRRHLPPRKMRPRLRVGFASAFFHVGTAGRYFRSWITQLDPARFEVFAYHLYPGLDEIASEVKARADRFVEFGGSRARPSVVAPVIRDDDLDVLVYPELGMDHTSFALAALRLAPRQLAGWGHPVTTGHATIDAFVTCGEMEPVGAEAHYTERLLSLPGIGTSYRRLIVPDSTTRARFDLPDGRALLLCPQSLFKVHPDNDELLAGVLAANPNAVLVMFHGSHPRIAEHFVERIVRTFDTHWVSAKERLILLPPQPHDDYLRVNMACDAVLDTLHWSGGNTSLDALACGVPIVTLPGRYMRGRQTAAMLRLLGLPELIASDRDGYIRIATRLVEDAVWRSELRRKIREANVALFDTDIATRSFADLLDGESAALRAQTQC